MYAGLACWCAGNSYHKTIDSTRRLCTISNMTWDTVTAVHKTILQLNSAHIKIWYLSDAWSMDTARWNTITCVIEQYCVYMHVAYTLTLQLQGKVIHIFVLLSCLLCLTTLFVYCYVMHSLRIRYIYRHRCATCTIQRSIQVTALTLIVTAICTLVVHSYEPHRVTLAVADVTIDVPQYSVVVLLIHEQWW